ncbi:hypothetical protein N9189_00865 [Pirellulaceae bacterium]|nr:hypothetical protein [Pirellulaceae bacterium]
MGTDEPTATAWRIKLGGGVFDEGEPKASTRYQADLILRFVTAPSSLHLRHCTFVTAPSSLHLRH